MLIAPGESELKTTTYTGLQIALALTAASPHAIAQPNANYPTKPIRMTVSSGAGDVFSAGGDIPMMQKPPRSPRWLPPMATR